MLDEEKNAHTQIINGGVGYQECIVININETKYLATNDIFNAFSYVLSLKLQNANEICSNLFLDLSTPKETLIERINSLIICILQLSLDLSDQFHRLRLKQEVKFFQVISKETEDSASKKTEDSASKETEDSTSNEPDSELKNNIIEVFKNINPSIEIEKIKRDVDAFFDDSTNKEIDEYDFDYEMIFKRIKYIAETEANNGYHSVIDSLTKVKEQLEDYKRKSCIYIYQEDYLTPLDVIFRFAIYDKSGNNVAYKKNDNKSGFEFFIERCDMQGKYDICCVIHDWNNVLASSSFFLDETDSNFIVPMQDIPIFDERKKAKTLFEKYPLALYRKYELIIEGTENKQTGGYSNYTSNGGKLIIKTCTTVESIKGKIILTSHRTQPNKTEEYFFYIFLKNKTKEIIEQKTITNEKYVAVKPRVKNRNLRCPYCAQELMINKWSKKNRYCNGDIAESKEGILCKNNNYLASDLYSSDGTVSSKYDFESFKYNSKGNNPEVPLVLPKNFTKSNSGVVSLIGDSNSGKSVFISNFFQITQSNMGGNQGWKSSIGPFINNSVFSFYMPQCSGEDSNKWEKSMKKKEKISYSDYMSTLFGHGPSRTSEKLNSVLVQMPFILKIKNTNNEVTSYLSFFDCPGEYIKNSHSDKNSLKHSDNYLNHPTTNSDAYIVFLDPTENEKLDLNGKIHDVTEIIATLSDKRNDCKHKPIAIVLSKFDLWLNQLIEKNDDSNNRFLSKVRCCVPFEDKDRVDYYGSKTQRYIDDCSKAVEDYFLEKHRAAFNDLKSHLLSFSSYKFFLISSLGRESSFCYLTSGTTPFILYRTKSNYNIDIVTLWLLIQLGIIR